MKRIACSLLMLILLLSAFAAPASAATMMQDSLTVTLTTDKQSYGEGDTVNATLTIYNGSDDVVRDVSVQYAAPALCAAEAGTKVVQKADTIAAGDTVTLNAAFVVKGAQVDDLPQTGDSSHMLLWLLLCGASVFAMFKMDRNARKQLTAIVLCVVLLSGMLPVNVISTAVAQKPDAAAQNRHPSAVRTEDDDGRRIVYKDHQTKRTPITIVPGNRITVSEMITVMGSSVELTTVVDYKDPKATADSVTANIAALMDKSLFDTMTADTVMMDWDEKPESAHPYQANADIVYRVDNEFIEFDNASKVENRYDAVLVYDGYEGEYIQCYTGTEMRNKRIGINWGYIRLYSDSSNQEYGFGLSDAYVVKGPEITRCEVQNDGSVKLEWEDYDQNRFSGYEVVREDVANPDAEWIDIFSDLDGHATSCVDRTALPGHTYRYRVYVMLLCDTADGEAFWGNCGPYAEITISDTNVNLAAPKNVDISCTSSAQGVAHWGAVSGATGYEIYQSTTKNGTYTKAGEKEGGTTKTITFLTSSGVNYVKVRAYKTVNGTRQYGEYSEPRLVFPVGIVNGVSATVSASSGNVVLKWNTTANAHKYKIFASDTENGTYSDVVTVLAKTTATQSASLSPSLQGKYIKIRTVRDDEGTRSHSAYSTPVKAEQLAALAAPTGVDVSCTSSTQGVVHWGAVSGATGYEILQSRTKTGTYTVTAEKTGGTTKTITFLTSSGVNYVKVRAYKTVNGVRQYGAESAPRLVFPVGIVNGVSATISSTSGNVVLKWNTTANAHKYKIFASDTENGTYTDVVTVLAKTTATQSASLNASLKDKYFKIRTVRDDEGTRSHSAYSTPVKVADAPAVPAVPTGVAAINMSSTSIYVNWYGVDGADGYYVYRADSSDGEYRCINQVTEIGYLDENLTDNTTYYYKIAAYNGNGTGAQSDYACATTGGSGPILRDPPNTPEDIAAAKAGSNSIRISWSKVSNADGYYVYRAESSDGSYNKIGTITSGNTLEYMDEGLSAKTYYYKVSAYNRFGESYKSDSVFATIPDPIPSTPTGVSARAVKSKVITITWNQVMNANGYYIYRANSSSGTFSRVGQVLVGDNTDYSDMGLSEGKTFYYKVSAYNEAGESGKSSYVYATTIPAPTNIVAIAQDSYSIKVSWAKVANVDGYHVYRANSSSGTYENVGTVSSGSTVNYVDTGLEAGRTYFYKVCAYKGADTSSLSSYDYVATPLPKPTNVSAVGKSKAIEVSWNPVTGATGYYVYRAAVATDPYMKVGTITSGSVTVWENTGLSANKTYYYKVSAYNDSGEGSKSNYTSATTLSGSVPSVPTGVNAKGVDNSSIEVSWNKVTDANGYHVYRSVGNDLNYQNINTIDSGDTTTYKNTNLESGTEYYYRVTAYNANGESQKSDYSSAMPDPWLRPGKPYAPKNVAAEAISSSSVRISWDKTSDTDGYHIYRSDSANGPYSNIGTITSSNTTSYTDTGLTAGKTYYYKVSAYNVDGEGDLSDYAYAAPTSKPSAPTNVSATGKSGAIEVTWNKVSNVTGYYVYRATTSSGPYTKIDTVTSGSTTSWTNSGLTANKTYYYKVSAYNSVGESSKSSYAYATTLSDQVLVTSVTLSQSSLSLAVGDTATLTATVKPTNATNKTVKWTSSNTTVATVGSTTGVVTAKASGSATIKATAQDGSGKYGSCSVTVTVKPTTPATPTGVQAAAQSSSSIKVSWNKVANATGYYVYRSTSSSSGYSKVKTITSGSTVTWTNTGLAADTKYYYKVSAYNDAGESSLSSYDYAWTDSETFFSITHVDEDILEMGTVTFSKDAGVGAFSTWTIDSSSSWSVTPSGDTSWYTLSCENGSSGTSTLKITLTKLPSAGQTLSSTLTFTSAGQTYTVRIQNVRDAVPTVKVKFNNTTYTGTGNDSGYAAYNDGTHSMWLDFYTENATNLEFSIKNSSGSAVEFITAYNYANGGGSTKKWSESITSSTAQPISLMFYILEGTEGGTYTAYVKATNSSGEDEAAFKFFIDPFLNTHINTGNYAEDLVAVATTQIGYTGSSSSANQTGANVSSPGNWTKYGAYTNCNNDQWCASFVSWCANQASIPKTVISPSTGASPGHLCPQAKKETGHVWYFELNNAMQEDHTYLKKYGIQTTRSTFVPKSGDLIFFRWDPNDDSYSFSHVGIVTEVLDGQVYYIDGNGDGDTVRRTHKSLTSTEIQAYCRPW